MKYFFFTLLFLSTFSYGRYRCEKVLSKILTEYHLGTLEYPTHLKKIKKSVIIKSKNIKRLRSKAEEILIQNQYPVDSIITLAPMTDKKRSLKPGPVALEIFERKGVVVAYKNNLSGGDLVLLDQHCAPHQIFSWGADYGPINIGLVSINKKLCLGIGPIADLAKTIDYGYNEYLKRRCQEQGGRIYKNKCRCNGELKNRFARGSLTPQNFIDPLFLQNAKLKEKIYQDPKIFRAYTCYATGPQKKSSLKWDEVKMQLNQIIDNTHWSHYNKQSTQYALRQCQKYFL